ncbi:helix-turn-helix domain-containing protein [Paenibacillus taichungensis]|nr:MULTISPECIES: helix-turn-helix domain-containing protein [Paenibacillus]MEC0106956.1 helix-turn-helix domain-containing protein [Paenibacillus taichungensis]MEC0195114.1 helix-turn-helix domain-containing protein [Paenibacillus taichungensis]WDQ35784.1 helix-turn-helix domain-containing protein [Paenibacillus marchantiae]
MIKLYIEGYSEKEVASQMNISQQAVNKWKKKMLKHLSETVNL